MQLRKIFLLSAALCLASSLFASSAAVPVGRPVDLTVTVDGSAPFSYQWMKDGVAINGANQSTYAIPVLSSSDVGTYTVRVSNASGSTVSDSAVISVAVAPYDLVITITVSG